MWPRVLKRMALDALKGLGGLAAVAAAAYAFVAAISSLIYLLVPGNTVPQWLAIAGWLVIAALAAMGLFVWADRTWWDVKIEMTREARERRGEQ